jgi:hypothetical protein
VIYSPQLENGIVLKGRNVHKYSMIKGPKAGVCSKRQYRGDIQPIRAGDKLRRGGLPLLWAFWAKNASGFETLLKNGANPNSMIGSNHIMRFFTEPIVSIESDDFEYKYDDAKFLELALKYGGDPNAVDSKYDTMLMTACMPGTLRRVELLIQYGAALEQRTSLRTTALLTCASLKQYEKVYYLLQKGANFSAKDKFGYDLVRIIEEEPFEVGQDPGSIGRKKTIQFLRDKGYKFVPNEDKPKNKNLRK